MQTATRESAIDPAGAFRWWWIASITFGLFRANALLGQTTPTASNGDRPASFSIDIAPILQKKCIACHGPEKKKGGYQAQTYELLMKGGESKSAAITPGRPDQSKLFQLITAKDADDRMPQKDDPLPPRSNRPH